MFERKINPIEKSVMFLSLNTMIQFKCHQKLDFNNLKKAILCTKQRFQYLRLKILKDNENFKFVEQNDQELNETKIEIVQLKSIEEFQTEWKERHILFGSKNHDLTLGVLFFHLYYYDNNYELYMSSNHSGNDARGHFIILKDIITNLENILCDKIELKDRKKFLNIHENISHNFCLDDLKAGPWYENEFQRLENIPRENIIEEKFKNLSYNFEFFQFDEETSLKIIQNCKLNKCSVQAIFSLASTIALVNEKIDLKSISDKIECLNSIPCDMRYYFGLDLEDLIKGAASLCWLQQLGKNDNLWSVAEQTTKVIHDMKNSNEGIKWWLKCLNGYNLSKYSHIASSLGKISLSEENLRNIKIMDLRFSCSTPYKAINDVFFKNSESRFQMMHVFTYSNRLTFNFCCSYPTFSSEWTKRFFQNVKNIMLSFKQENLFLDDVIPLLLR
ncbi:unnamed protein product [Brachionus calyciflorus]|uniref:Condensation domain-containing protein n=1 Tax=Brachionus calyciflorus TaxID=104777 RepID=A0A814E8A7_9BILA|nr:unnamed protein product [Brachionus calyciflorus]